jgi:hypothetical protein
VSRPPYLLGEEHWIRALCRDAESADPLFALFSAVPTFVE